MPKEGYETFNVVWDGRQIEVSFQGNWLNTGHWHLELRCTDPLPVTQTGYRSAFVVADLIADGQAVESFVLDWLDHAAEDPAWKRFVEDSRQMSLF